MTGNSPLFGSDWKPLRNGKKSTASDVVAVPSASAAPLTGFSGGAGLVAGEIAGPGLTARAVVRRPHQLFSAFTGAAVLAVVPSSWTLKTPYELSVRLSRWNTDAAPPIRRTAAALFRFSLLTDVPPRFGAPVPWTRFCEIVLSVIVALEPAVMRTPSWP